MEPVDGDIPGEPSISAHDRELSAEPVGNQGHSSGTELVNRAAAAHSIRAGRRIRREFLCCVTTRGPDPEFSPRPRDRLPLRMPPDHVDVWPRLPHAAFGFRVTGGASAAVWQPANAAPVAGSQAPGNNAGSSDSERKRDRIPSVNTCDAAAAVWPHVAKMEYAGAVPWEVLSPSRTAPGGFGEPSGALFC